MQTEQRGLFPDEETEERWREKERREFHRRERDAAHERWLWRKRKREAKARTDKKVRISGLRAEEAVSYVEGTGGCRACGQGMAEVAVLVYDLEGKPGVGFACRECAGYFDKPPRKGAKERS